MENFIKDFLKTQECYTHRISHSCVLSKTLKGCQHSHLHSITMSWGEQKNFEYFFVIYFRIILAFTTSSHWLTTPLVIAAAIKYLITFGNNIGNIYIYTHTPLLTSCELLIMSIKTKLMHWWNAKNMRNIIHHNLFGAFWNIKTQVT